MLNQITLMGRLTKDPELRFTNNKTPVASFSIAVERDIATNGNKETDFINCVAWRTTGEFISKYFSKGSLIAVVGRLQIRSYTNKNGDKVNVAEVVVDRAYFCGGKNEKKEERPNTAVNTPLKPQFVEVDEDDELPFGGKEWGDEQKNQE